MSVSACFTTIPAVFWSAIFGSVLTLGGVLLIDRGNTKRQKQQIENAAEEAKRARAATVRKEVYLKTASELTKGMANLGKLAQADLTNPNFSDGFNNFYETAAQFQLVAELDTSLLMIKYVAAIELIHHRAMSRLPAIFQEKISAAGEEDTSKKSLANALETLAEQKALHKVHPEKTAEFSALQDVLVFWQQDSAMHHQKQLEHLAKQNELCKTAGSELMKDLHATADAQLDLLVQMRRELGFESDVTSYRKTMKEARGKVQESVMKFLANTSD